MLPLISNLFFAILFFILMLVAAIVALAILFGEEQVLPRWSAAIVLLFGVALGFGWHYSATHRIVPPQQRWIYIDKLTGNPIGNIRKSGPTEKPLLMFDVHKFPGAPEQLFCLKYYPALKEGYELEIDMCGTYDAANLNWIAQYTNHTFTSEQEMLDFWAVQTKEGVSDALKPIAYTDLVSDRLKVSNAIRAAIEPWFAENGFGVMNLKMKNWDFTSEEVKAIVDSGTAASMTTTIELQLLEAAKIARQRQIYEVETANLVMQERGVALEALFMSLDLHDDAAKAYIASQMTWYAYLQQPAEGVTVVLGVGDAPIVTSQQLPAQQPLQQELAP